MSEPTIIIPDLTGKHNTEIEASVNRLHKSATYRDLSTVIICPTRGVISATVVQSWLGIIKPMNQKVIGPIFIQGMEVGEAYEAAIDLILNNPELNTYKYMLTIEEDNTPPPDGLLKLYESIEGEVDGVKYDIASGLYWTKGELGQPMIYGNPDEHPVHFIPQKPIPEAVQRCNGTGMGFSLFRLQMFKDGRIERPFFKTVNQYIPGQGTQVMTQDLYFFQNAGAKGYKVCSDNRVRVGHFDINSGITW